MRCSKGIVATRRAAAGGFFVVASDVSNGGDSGLNLGTVKVGDLVVCTSNKRSTGTATATLLSVDGASVAQISTLTTLVASTRYDTGGTSDGAATVQYGFVTTAGSLVLTSTVHDLQAATVYRGLSSVTQAKYQNNGGTTVFDLDFDSTPTGVVIGVIEGGGTSPTSTPTLDDDEDWTAVNFHLHAAGDPYFKAGVQWWSTAQPSGLHGDTDSNFVSNGGQLVAIIEAALA